MLGETKDTNKMNRLGDMLAEIICDFKNSHPDMYYKYKMELYELLNGQQLTEDKAGEWIRSMRPLGMHWTLEQTNEVHKEHKLEVDKIDFWAMMNAMYNDYHDIFQDNVETYISLAKDFICDEDAEPNKTYIYWKNIAKK
jgi:hypothetical protein